MPKDVVHIKQFHGGINDASESTDISDNECQTANNCDFSNVGKITLSGDLKGTHDAETEPHTVTTPGSGLFAFRHDRDQNGTNATTNYYATHDLNVVSVYDTNENDWLAITTNGSAAGEWSDNSSNGSTLPLNDVNFLFHEGVLRSSDGKLVSGNQRKWWGYINRRHFGIASHAREDAYAGMISHDADLAAPTAGTCHLSDDQGHDTGVMHMEANITSSGGSIPAANYRIAYSFKYDNHQESNLKEFVNSPLAITEGQCFGDGSSNVTNFTFHTLNSRIVGSRVYVQRADTTDDWTLLVDIDLQKGWRLGLNEDYSSTWAGTSDNVDLPLTGTKITRLGPTTYSNINGYAFDEPIDCSYKTAVVVDGITYAGNILQNGNKYPDRVIKCAIVRDGIASDVFPESNFLDVTPNDGDEIVKLETFQDKVLVFKRQTLFVVNYSADIGDYLDATFPFMGIRNRGHSFPTAHGIAFMNDLGVHLYNGETVLNLTGKMPDISIPAFTSTAGANDVPLPKVNRDVNAQIVHSILSEGSYNSDQDVNNDGIVNVQDLFSKNEE